MIFDILLCIVCAIAFIRGWQKGILWAAISFLAIFIGIIVSLKLSHTLADILFKHDILAGKYTLLLSFVVLFLVVIALFRMGTKLIEQALDKLLLGWANKVSGGFLYAGFAALLFSLFCWLSAKSGLLSEELKNDSKTFAYIEPIAPKVIAVSSEYLPLCKNLYQDVLDMLSNVGDKVDKNIKKLR